MELFVADAFTTRRFSGNQAGVALLGEADFPEEGFMRALAGELKHSETAFVRRTGEGSFHIRYFTPAEEVDLCGHATIASFTVLRERRAIGPGTYALHTRSGDLSIQVGADAVWMDMAPPADGRSFSEEEQAELYAAYGLSLADRPEGLEAQAADIMRTVAKLDQIGPVTVKALLFEQGVSEQAAGEILDFIAITGDNAAVLAALEGYRGRNEIFDQGLEELATVVKYLAAFGVPEDHFAVDLTIARGLDYYTGTVYETVMLDHPEIGSICSGGRYDNLAEYYTDKKLPGVGISIGLTRLFYVLGEQGYLNDQLVTAPADVLILPMTEDLSPAIAFATQLRQGGVRAQVYSEQKKFKGKMSYADKLHIPYVAFLGEEEISQGLVKIKDMVTGDQQALSPAQAVETIAAAMAHRAQGKPIREKG